MVVITGGKTAVVLDLGEKEGSVYSFISGYIPVVKCFLCKRLFYILWRRLRITVFLKNWRDFQTMNQIYVEFFAKDPPARSTIEVVGLALGALVEIEAVAIVD